MTSIEFQHYDELLQERNHYKHLWESVVKVSLDTIEIEKNKIKQIKIDSLNETTKRLY